MKLKYILVFCCFFICEEVVNAAYEIIFEKLEPASEDDRVGTFHGLRVKKFNRTAFVINGRYQSKIITGNEIDLMIEGYNFQGGQYKKMVEKKLNQFCTSLYNDAFRSEYEKYNDASSAKVPFGTCPYPIVNNTITNLLISNNGILPPYIPGGEKWRINVRLLRGDEILGGYNLYALLRNEQSVLKG